MELNVSKSNPASLPEKSTPERKRIPMSLPVQKLAVPEGVLPGYYLYWMRGDAQRIEQALKAGYDFVAPEEVDLNRFGIANGEKDSGNEDLGSRVSVVAGTGEGGQAARLYLMKLPEQYHQDDLKMAGLQQEKMASQLRGDKGFSEAGADKSNRYSRGEQNTLFTPKPSR